MSAHQTLQVLQVGVLDSSAGNSGLESCGPWCSVPPNKATGSQKEEGANSIKYQTMISTIYTNLEWHLLHKMTHSTWSGFDNFLNSMQGHQESATFHYLPLHLSTSNKVVFGYSWWSSNKWLPKTYLGGFRLATIAFGPSQNNASNSALGASIWKPRFNLPAGSPLGVFKSTCGKLYAAAKSANALLPQPCRNLRCLKAYDQTTPSWIIMGNW